MEGRETRSTLGDVAASKGKGKVMASSGNTSSREKPTFPPSLEVLMFDLSLFEEPLLKDSGEEVFSLLGAVYAREAIKGVQDLLKDATSFKMAAFVSTFLILCLLSVYVRIFYFLFVILFDSCR